IEGCHLVGLPVPDRQDDDRHLAPPPEPTDDIDPVDAGQTEIEDDDIGVVPRRQLEGLLAGAGEVDVVAARPEVHLQGLADLWLVVDDEHPADHEPGNPAGRNVAPKTPIGGHFGATFARASGWTLIRTAAAKAPSSCRRRGCPRRGSRRPSPPRTHERPPGRARRHWGGPGPDRR